MIHGAVAADRIARNATENAQRADSDIAGEHLRAKGRVTGTNAGGAGGECRIAVRGTAAGSLADPIPSDSKRSRCRPGGQVVGGGACAQAVSAGPRRQVVPGGSRSQSAPLFKYLPRHELQLSERMARRLQPGSMGTSGCQGGTSPEGIVFLERSCSSAGPEGRGGLTALAAEDRRRRLGVAIYVSELQTSHSARDAYAARTTTHNARPPGFVNVFAGRTVKRNSNARRPAGLGRQRPPPAAAGGASNQAVRRSARCRSGPFGTVRLQIKRSVYGDFSSWAHAGEAWAHS
jgi:hypothetical protein